MHFFYENNNSTIYNVTQLSLNAKSAPNKHFTLTDKISMQSNATGSLKYVGQAVLSLLYKS